MSELITESSDKIVTEGSDQLVTEDHVGGVDALTANDVSTTSEVDSPALSQVHALAANDVSVDSEVSTPEVGQGHDLSATDVKSASEVTNPVLTSVAGTDNLSGEDVESDSQVSGPTLGQEHELAAQDVSADSQVSAPELTSDSTEDNLSADDIESQSSVAAAILEQIHALTPDGIESATGFNAPALGEPIVTVSTGNVVIPIQAATLGHIPGGPFCVATLGLLKCGKTKGGRVRYVKMPKIGTFEIEHPHEVIDVTHLEVLVSAMARDVDELRGRIIDEGALRQVEEEIAALFLELVK